MCSVSSVPLENTYVKQCNKFQIWATGLKTFTYPSDLYHGQLEVPTLTLPNSKSLNFFFCLFCFDQCFTARQNNSYSNPYLLPIVLSLWLPKCYSGWSYSTQSSSRGKYSCCNFYNKCISWLAPHIPFSSNTSCPRTLHLLNLCSLA